LFHSLAILGLALLIGVVLGALGSGGAILALPVLVYAGGLPPVQAIAVSQIVVGVAALFGAALQAFQRRVSWRHAALYTVAGIPGTRLGHNLRELLPPDWLLGLFAVILVAAGFRMLRGPEEIPESRSSAALSLSIGATVGLLTGLLGVGGGFLLVPAMIAFGGLPTKAAMATSLPVIALNSLSGAFQSRALWLPHAPLVLSFLAATLTGTFVGIRWGRRFPETRLRDALAWLLVIVGLAVPVSIWRGSSSGP
jgi:hypothetical protein